MGIENIKSDLSVQPQYQTQYRSYEQPVNSETAKTSGNDTENSVSKINNINNISAAVNGQQKLLSSYEENQSKIVLEQEMDKLLKQIMPDLGVKFRVHESGQIITTVLNNETKEVLREFPAEKMLDIVYNMCQKLGIVINKKV